MDLKVVISENLKALMKSAQDVSLRTDKGLGARAEVSYKTVQRLRLPQTNPDYAPALDSLHRLAHAFDIEVWELLRPRHLRAKIEGNQVRHPENQRDTADSAERTLGRKANK